MNKDEDKTEEIDQTEQEPENRQLSMKERWAIDDANGFGFVRVEHAKKFD